MPKPFERLRDRLLCAGVAPRYVRRYMAELDDHLADIVFTLERDGLARREAEPAALARLGSVDTLAEAMIARRELRSWAARLPWAAFLAAPLLGLVAAFVAGLGLLVAIIQMHRPDAIGPTILPGWFDPLRTAIFGLDLYLLPVALGWSVSVIALRQRTTPFWPLLGLIAVALIGGAAQFDLVVPTAPGMHGEVSVGLGLIPPFSGFQGSATRALLNLLLTLPGYLLLRRKSLIAA